MKLAPALLVALLISNLIWAIKYRVDAATVEGEENWYRYQLANQSRPLLTDEIPSRYGPPGYDHYLDVIIEQQPLTDSEELAVHEFLRKLEEWKAADNKGGRS